MKYAEDIYAPEYVKNIFDKCSKKYIAFSFICSFGFTERWRKQAVKFMPKPMTARCKGYDLMAGTGEIWSHILKRFPEIEAINAIDISSGMHERAIKRLDKYRAGKIQFIEHDVLQSSLPADSCDFIISTFGLKTFNEAQQKQLSNLVANTLKPGGVFSFIEASDPKGWWLRSLYIFHLKAVLPMIERVFMKGAQDFSMIGAYSINFRNAKMFSNFLEGHGLEVEYKTYFFGCATGVVGRKPV